MFSVFSGCVALHLPSKVPQKCNFSCMLLGSYYTTAFLAYAGGEDATSSHEQQM